MNSLLSLQTRKRKRLRLSLVVGGLLIIIFIGYSLFSPLSPDAVCSLTVRALETHNADALVALADPEELTKLNLSVGSVRNFLVETLWKSDYTGPHRYKRIIRREPDSAMYEVKSASSSPDPQTTPLNIPIVDSPDKGWKLNLSALLFYTCYQRHPDGDRTEWRALRDKYDIRGIRQVTGEYTIRNHPQQSSTADTH